MKMQSLFKRRLSARRLVDRDGWMRGAVPPSLHLGERRGEGGGCDEEGTSKAIPLAGRAAACVRDARPLRLTERLTRGAVPLSPPINLVASLAARRSPCAGAHRVSHLIAEVRRRRLAPPHAGRAAIRSGAETRS